MSYGIEVIKDSEGVRVVSSSALKYIPDGRFTISGHQPAEGMSSIATIGVTLYSDGQFVSGSNASFTVPKIEISAGGTPSES